jgi:hypothetical protein
MYCGTVHVFAWKYLEYLGEAQRGGLFCRSRPEPGTNRTRTTLQKHPGLVLVTVGGISYQCLLSFAGSIMGMAGA